MPPGLAACSEAVLPPDLLDLAEHLQQLRQAAISCPVSLINRLLGETLRRGRSPVPGRSQAG